MTTIIAQDSVFAAVDQLWTDENDLPAAAPFKKIYVLNDSILFFSGYIDPILAILAGYIGERIGIDDDFAEWIAKYVEAERKTCEFFEVDRATGAIIYYFGAEKLTELGCIFYCAGSGSKYAIDSYINSVSIISSNGVFDFAQHGVNLITQSMNIAFQRDQCSGGDFNFIVWQKNSVAIDKLDWVADADVDDYNESIRTKIIERFESIDSLKEMITWIEDESKEDEKEMEIEAKIFDQQEVKSYSPETNLAAKGRSTMSDTTQQKPRVAVKTSGSSRGAVLSASSLKARLAQRKAEGLS
ncbi:hypothetical protein [Klebsiella aerogenes]|uniref:hypothetical protein n=1 Tax=Klebsiella aerogenes TaxID=548 RepID=UPI003D315B44